MKQTKKFLSILRIAFGIVILILITLCAFIIGLDLTNIYSALIAAWPFAAVIIACYVIFSLSEDYVNSRILRPHV